MERVLCQCVSFQSRTSLKEKELIGLFRAVWKAVVAGSGGKGPTKRGTPFHPRASFSLLGYSPSCGTLFLP